MKLYSITRTNSELQQQAYGLHVALSSLPQETTKIESRSQNEIWAFDENGKLIATIKEVR